MGDNARLMKEEVEIKLSLPASAHRAFLRHPLLLQAEKLAARKLVNVYYDTPDLALHRKGIALRTRRQGRGWLQTVKCAGTTSGGLAVRPEWEQPYGGRFDFAGIDDPPLRELLERQRVRAHLEPAFETVFTRLAWRLRPAQGSAILLMLDRGWIEAGDKRETLSEIEIELEEGRTDALFDLALTLAADLPLRPEILSKAERGYRLRLGTPLKPVKAAPSPLGAAQAPLDAFRAIAAACIAQLQWNALGAGEHPQAFQAARDVVEAARLVHIDRNTERGELVEVRVAIAGFPRDHEVGFQRGDGLHVDVAVAADARQLAGYFRVVAVGDRADDLRAGAGREQ
jgi:adenylate cyclase